MQISFYFHHGDYGWHGGAEDIEWDGVGDHEPTDEDAEAALDYWLDAGIQEAAQDHMNGYADYMEHMY